MKPVRSLVIAAITLVGTMTILSAALFSRCRCCGKRFTPVLCLVPDWTPTVRADFPTCRDNLAMLEIAKYEWAGEHGADYGDEVTWHDLRIYLRDNKPPVCNQGGHYVLGRIGEEPDCVGACPLHANPLEHALEPAVLYASGEANPLAAARTVFIERRRARQESNNDPPGQDGE
jgi:hypothetical protein